MKTSAARGNFFLPSSFSTKRSPIEKIVLDEQEIDRAGSSSSQRSLSASEERSAKRVRSKITSSGTMFAF